MADFVDANGVHTYFEEYGAGDPLLLLHGGLSNADDFGMQTPALAEHYRVILPERRAHGHTADVDGPITYEVMADDTIAFMEALETGPAHLVGWSDGGNVALIVGFKRPDLVRKIATTGANFSTKGYVDGFQASFTPDSDALTMMRNDWVERTPDGADHFPVVLEKIEQLWFGDWSIPAADLARIAAPVLVMSGDDDAVRLDHTLALYEAVPNAQLAVIPGGRTWCRSRRPTCSTSSCSTSWRPDHPRSCCRSAGSRRRTAWETDAMATRDKPWLMRTYSGHSSARASNELYRTNLARGQTGLSVAFDLPTQTGYDPDHVLAQGEVGKVGVPVPHLGEMRTLFDGIPLDEMNTSMTINATAMWLLGMYIGARRGAGGRPRAARWHRAERHRQGVPEPRDVHLPARGRRGASPST